MELQKRIKSNRKRLGKLVWMHVGIILVLAVLAATVWHCPVRLLFGVPCPGCGTTRACLALLRLDTGAAFAYQPVFFLNVLLFWYCIHNNIIRRNWIDRGHTWNERLELFLVSLGIGVILTVYVVRLVRQDSPVMEIHLEEGLVFRAAGILRGIFH